MNARILISVAVLIGTSAASAAVQYRESATLVPKGDKGNTETLNVEGGRLVEQAVLQLIYKHGYRISYEDPRVTFDDDFEDITQQVTDAPAPTQKARIIVPKSRKMSVDLETSRGVENMLNQIVASASGVNPGARFRVQTDNSMFHVVPTGGRDKNGGATSQGSLLDTRISLPMQARTADEMLRAICATLASESRQDVAIGNHGYLPYPEELRYTIGAIDEPARAVLKRTLDAIGVERGAATWVLLYGKNEDRFYLSIIQLPDFAAAKMSATPAATLKEPVKKHDPAQDASQTRVPGK